MGSTLTMCVCACVRNMSFRMLVNKWQNTRVPITLLRTEQTYTCEAAFTITIKKNTHTQANQQTNEMKKKERTKKCIVENKLEPNNQKIFSTIQKQSILFRVFIYVSHT